MKPSKTEELIPKLNYKKLTINTPESENEDYRDIFSVVREQVNNMASQGEAAVKQADTSEKSSKAKDKKGINKVVVENMTNLLEQLLFQSGLSKRDS